jgi:hypothetical protein
MVKSKGCMTLSYAGEDEPTGAGVPANVPPADDEKARTVRPPKGSKPISLFGNALWNVGFTLWTMVVGLFMVRFLVDNLGDAHYGLYALLFVITGVLDVMNLGLSEATVRYVAHYHARHDMAGVNRVFGATLTVYSLMAFVGWAVLFFGAPWCARILKIDAQDLPLAERVIRLTAVTFGLAFVSGVFQAVPQAMRRYDVGVEPGHGASDAGGLRGGCEMAGSRAPSETTSDSRGTQGGVRLRRVCVHEPGPGYGVAVHGSRAAGCSSRFERGCLSLGTADPELQGPFSCCQRRSRTLPEVQRHNLP